MRAGEHKLEEGARGIGGGGPEKARGWPGQWSTPYLTSPHFSPLGLVVSSGTSPSRLSEGIQSLPSRGGTCGKDSSGLGRAGG